MVDESTINSSLKIQVGSLDYISRPSSFKADVSAAGGPTPGQILATTAGVNVDLSAIATPGLCRIQNLEPTGGNFVQVGVHDTVNFFPLMDLLPGESYTFRLATDVASGSNDLRVKSDTASVKVLVEAFLK